MSKHKISIKDLKSQINSLQDKLEREEQKLNCEIGDWIRQQTITPSTINPNMFFKNFVYA